MNHRDSKGYYQLLGIPPGSNISTIKAAYRKRAIYLHPDKNPGKDTTKQFQALQQAYDVLSDQRQREQYDAECSVPSAEPSREEQPQKVEPIYCSVCHKVSAQPRYRVFYYIISYLFGSYKDAFQGIYCSECETKTALKATAITVVLGWWGVIGFFWTLHALIHNLTGGRFYEHNARLQAYQAWYFAVTSRASLARAGALQALELCYKATNGRLSPADKGYETFGPLMQQLDQLLVALPTEKAGLKLRSTDGWFTRRFIYQAVLLVLFAGLISAEWYRNEENAKATERTRLEREGLKRAEAEAVAAREAEALKKLEQPLPQTGILGGKKKRFDLDSLPPFRLENAPADHTLLKLVRASDGVEVVTIFVRAGESIELGIPPGTYRAKTASGQIWYGDAVRFGPSTHYSELDKTLEFKVEGLQLLGHRLALQRMRQGNLGEHYLSASDF